MSTWLALGRSALAGLLAVLPLLRRVKALRDAGANPHSAPASHDEELLARALKSLGAVGHDDSLWKKFKTGVVATIVRPEHFSRPHIREWLSNPEAKAALKSLVKAQLVAAPEPLQDRETLLSLYMQISGEHISYAESNVLAATAFLKASLHVAAKDAGVAAMVQAGIAGLHGRSDIVDRKLDEIASAQALIGSGAVSEHHGQDAETSLKGILKRRATPGNTALVELRELARFLDPGGRFAAAPLPVKAQVYDWIARLSASNKALPEAEEALRKLEELGHKASAPTLAWVEVARGHVDAALRALEPLDSSESRSVIFGILRIKKGSETALAYLEDQNLASPCHFTPVGWANVISCLAELGKTEKATDVLSALPDDLTIECPILGYIRGMVYAANSVSVELRDRIFQEQYLGAVDHLLDGDDADMWRDKARQSFEACRKYATDADDAPLIERSIGWLRWLRLVDPVSRQSEREALRTDMNDGGVAVDLMPLAHAFQEKFDPTALKKHLERAEMLRGLAPKELNAKVLLLGHLGLHSELASFIVDNWGRLAEFESVAALGGTLIQAYVQAGECGRAEEALETWLADLHPPDIPRYRLMIQDCRGEDPTGKARENFEASGALEDLANLVRSLEGKRRWTELAPYAMELFNREPNAANALRHVECLRRSNSSDEDVVRFLDDWPDLTERNPELMSAQAWALFHLGRVDDSRKLNDRLLGMRRHVNELGLDINLAVRMGDWERLPAILEREWETRGGIPTRLLLHLARLTSSSARERALQLVRECAEKDANNPHVLLQAYAVATAMACDDIAMPLVNKAAQLSKGKDGPVWNVSTPKMMEMVKASADDWRKKNELFRGGSIPIHWSAHILNIPLSRLLVAIPLENKAQADARRRQPIPIRAGSRRPVGASAVKRLALDITSIFILSELGFVERLLATLDEVLLSPRFMEALLFEEEKVRFHQPSRIEDAKPLLELHRKRLLQATDVIGPTELAAEVGEEEASLLAAARTSGGLCLHSGKLYRVGSFMDEEATLGDFALNLANPTVVAHALHEEGRITASTRDKALEYLNRVSAGETQAAALVPKASVFLDRVSAQYLSAAGLLGDLVMSDRKVFVHASAIEEWQALVDAEPHSQSIVDVLEGMRRTLREGMAKGKVRFLREGKDEDREDKLGGAGLPMLDLFEDLGQVDAVCIDDRLLNSQHILEDRRGRKVDLLCSLDVIDMLVERGFATTVEREEAIHKMREWCFSAIPVDVSEFLKQLMDRRADESGILSESAQLRVIREYLARLHSSDFLCAPSDLEYMDELWRNGQKIIREVWSDEKSNVADIIARANWVVDHVIPDIELALRFAADGKDRMEDIAVARLFGALLPVAVPNALKANFAEWLERKIIAPYLPSGAPVVDKAAELIRAWVTERSVEITNELEKLGGEGNDQDLPRNDRQEDSRQ